MKVIRRTFVFLILICYIAASVFKSRFWGDILSPIITFETFFVIYKAFCWKEKKGADRIFGLFLSLSVLVWFIADVLWAFGELIFHINPDNLLVITILYALTNVFLTAALTIFCFRLFRRWNVIQMLLDSLVMSYLAISLAWIVFFDENFRNFLLIRSDIISIASIILDIMMAICIIIWYMSVRAGRFPIYLRFISAGVLLYCITDLMYFYEYFYKTYEPNSILDAVYLLSFRLFAVAAMLRLDSGYRKEDTYLNNAGSKGKGYMLLLAPAMLILFKGFEVNNLLRFILVILIYAVFTTYIQNSIHKEGLLKKEQAINLDLEQKVKVRTEELEEKNSELKKLINQDIVTGLYNRRYLLPYLEDEITNLKQGERIALLYIDINRFKMISTMFGHYVGEKILHELAVRLKPIEHWEHSLLTHYGDDAYVFTAIGSYDYKQGYDLAKEAIRLCSDIYQVDDYQIRITVNIGISIYPEDASTKEELIKHADIAMTQARVQGFNRINEFDLKLSEVFFRRSTLEIMLKKVNFKEEFSVFYQPELETGSGNIVGFEALLRWRTSEGEQISPSEFIPVAEETGYIIPIGNWVMKMALKQLLDWNTRFRHKIMIGINVSLKQLNSVQFFERLKEEIELLQIKPEWVDVEITESLQLQENPDVIKMIQDIRKLGIRISIDDFGTGYSSLSYFKNLPADRIKLAKELVDYVHVDDFDYQLVKSIIMLSKAKGIKVIAEGVETKEQWEALKKLQCDEVQGFFFGRPVPPDQIEAAYNDLLEAAEEILL